MDGYGVGIHRHSPLVALLGVCARRAVAHKSGSGAEITDFVRRYGAFAKRTAAGDVDHLLLTSLVDRQGMLRVQYLGYRFDPDEMLRDMRSLLNE